MGHSRTVPKEFTSAASRAAEPSSASIHHIDSPPKHGQPRITVSSPQIPRTLRTEVEIVALPADLDGLPSPVRSTTKVRFVKEVEVLFNDTGTLARQCGAHLAGIHVVSAGRPEHRSDYYVVGEKAIRASLAWEKAADEAVTIKVRRRFEAISAKRDLSAEFRVIRRGGPNEDLILGSLHSDLVVIGQRQLQELPGYLSPERLLLASGAPILVVPSGWKSELIGQKILVGWNASREARRAVADALPFLVAAPSVTLLVVDSNERADRHGEEPGADIALYLARHGAKVEVEQVSSRGSPIADVILSYAADHGMDLIVIGAYSHARSVELVFGGVTRTLLKRGPIPVLMSR